MCLCVWEEKDGKGIREAGGGDRVHLGHERAARDDLLKRNRQRGCVRCGYGVVNVGQAEQVRQRQRQGRGGPGKGKGVVETGAEVGRAAKRTLDACAAKQLQACSTTL